MVVSAPTDAAGGGDHRARTRWIAKANTASTMVSWSLLAVWIVMALVSVVVASSSETTLGSLASGAKGFVFVVVPAALATTVVGTALGFASMRFSSGFNRVSMRVFGLLGGFPTIVFVVLVQASAASRSWWLMVTSLALVRLPHQSRLVRLHTMQFRASEVSVAAHALGASSWRVLTVHVLALIRPLLLHATLTNMAVLLAVQSAIAYFGIATRGATPEELAARVLTPSWGTQVGVLLGNGEYATMLVPLLAIALTILGLGIVARASRRTRLEQRLERHCQ